LDVYELLSFVVVAAVVDVADADVVGGVVLVLCWCCC